MLLETLLHTPTGGKEKKKLSINLRTVFCCCLFLTQNAKGNKKLYCIYHIVILSCEWVWRRHISVWFGRPKGKVSSLSPA